MDDLGLTLAPGPDDVRALARSSPWRFRTLHWTHHTAMLDPEELSHHVDLTDVHAGDATAARPGGRPRRHGRVTSPAAAAALCCSGRSASSWSTAPSTTENGAGGRPAGRTCPPHTSCLDVRTGIVVDVTPMDGSGGTRLSNEIHAVDTDLAPPAPAGGHRSR